LKFFSPTIGASSKIPKIALIHWPRATFLWSAHKDASTWKIHALNQSGGAYQVLDMSFLEAILYFVSND